MSEYLYTYGTLRPGKANTVVVPGKIYDLGWFPGLVMGEGEVVCEKLEIKDWSWVDRYEGYYPDDPENSLYIRRPFEDGFIYEYNRQVPDDKLIASGDWLKHTCKESGSNVERFS